MRKTSLILSSAPYGVALILLVLLLTAQGMVGLLFVLIGIGIAPVLLIMSVVSVVLAFRKTEDRTYDKVAKVMSLISLAIFGSLGVLASIRIVIAITNAMTPIPNVIYHG
jgi:cytochrome bd-type quinol oxidase subunit 1